MNTIEINRKNAVKIFDWCKKTFGMSTINGSYPRLVFHRVGKDYAGWYDPWKNDAEIVDFEASCRVSSSAINDCGFVQDIEKPDIIFNGLSYSSVVKDFYKVKVDIGKEYDETNIHLLYNKFPGWITEQEQDNDIKHLKQIIQIISSYFDDLYNKIGEISQYKKIKHNSSEENVYPFYDKILTSAGFDVTDLFNNLDIVEKVSSRNDITIFDQDLQKIKNSIFQNIYYNLSYILKSKGTEKSIKTFLKSYGINEDLVKINLYADGVNYNIVDREKQAVVKKKTIATKNSSSVYLSSSAIYEDGSLNYYTLETAFTLPSSQALEVGQTGSLFGIQNNAVDELQWTSNNSQYFVTIESYDDGCKFCLNDSFSNISSTDVLKNVYDNTVWNLALRKKPNVDTLNGADLSSLTYTIELYGINTNTQQIQEFSCSLPYQNFEGYTRYYIGARNNDLTGPLIYEGVSKFLYCNFWTDYLNNDTITSHNRKILNYGTDE